MVRSTRVLAATLALTFLPFAFCSSAAAQSKKNADFLPGTVVSIEKVEKDRTGRTYKMKFKSTADDEEIDVIIMPRTQLVVSAKGDEGFLKPNVFVQTRLLAANKEYFGKDFTVILGGNPPGYAKPDPANKEIVDISGKVTMIDAMGMVVQCGPQPVKVTFESTKAVTVKISDASLIQEGDTVDIEGPIIKAKKTMNAVAVNVTSAKEMNSEEYFASLEDRKKTKTSKTKAPAKSKTKTEDEPAGAAGKEAADPFGVLNKKKGEKATKEEKPDAAAKKEAEKKDDAKKDEAKKDSAEKKEGEKADKP